MTGWVYLVALLVTIASVTYGAGPYMPAASGSRRRSTPPSSARWLILALATVINFLGTKVLRMAAILGFTAEIIGALVVGGWLLIAHREHGLGVLFDCFGTGGTAATSGPSRPPR